MTPRIQVVSRRYERKNKWVDFVGEYHLELILRFGGVPIILPRLSGTAKILDQFEPMHGLLIVEGEDVSPSRYQGIKDSQRWIQELDLSKDEVEFGLMKRALAGDVPILGICRGCHILNVVSGGTLYADVQREKGSSLKHSDKDNYDTYRHPIQIKSDTPLARWYEAGRLMVNSYHHQGVRKLASCFAPMAVSSDGLVEGFYDPHQAFRIGLQFHPERMLQDEPRGAKVYEDFVRAAGK